MPCATSSSSRRSRSRPRCASRAPPPRSTDVRLLGIVQEAAARRRRARCSPTSSASTRRRSTPRQLDRGRPSSCERRHGELHRIARHPRAAAGPARARSRRALGVPGTEPETADLFRDKARMKDELRRHGLPCARHRLIRSWRDAEAFVAEVGFPIVLKPPAGMGCKATWRISSLDELRARARARCTPSPEQPGARRGVPARPRVQLRDRSPIGGEVRFHSISRYYPTPLEVMETPVDPVGRACCRATSTGPSYDDARELGVRAVKALGLETGFTHMEWFRRDDGSLAIGEIAARPPGANIVLHERLRPRRRHVPGVGARRRRRRVRRPVRAQVRRRLRLPARRRAAAASSRVTGVDARATSWSASCVVEAQLPHARRAAAPTATRATAT